MPDLKNITEQDYSSTENEIKDISYETLNQKVINGQVETNQDTLPEDSDEDEENQSNESKENKKENVRVKQKEKTNKKAISKDANQEAKAEKEKRQDEKISEYGQVTLDNNENSHKIHLLSIIGEIEGHECLSQNTKTKHKKQTY